MNDISKLQAFEAWLEGRTTEAHERLKQGIDIVMRATQDLASDAAVEVMSSVKSLESKDIEHTEPEAFMRLCRAVADAFPDEQPSDEQILSFAYAPALMRYFIASLKRCKSADPKHIAAGFLASRPKAQPSLERADGPELLKLAKEPFKLARAEGQSVEDALKLAANSAHDQWYGVSTDEIQVQKRVRRINRMLRDEWFGEPGASLNRPVKRP